MRRGRQPMFQPTRAQWKPGHQDALRPLRDYAREILAGDPRLTEAQVNRMIVAKFRRPLPGSSVTGLIQQARRGR